MPSSLRRRLRLARRGLWYVTAVTLVLAALGAAVVSQLLPLAERNPDRIAAWLSARAGRTVSFDALQTEWTRRGPLLRLDGLRVGDGADAIPIGEAEILVAQYAGLLPGRSFTELRIRNLSLVLERGDDGTWRVRGLPGQQQTGDPLGALEGLGELQVIDAKLGIHAPQLRIDATVPDIDLRLRVDGDRVRAGARARIRADVAPVALAFTFDRASGDGRLYAAARDADLSAWAPLLRGLGARIDRGTGDAEAWATLRARRVADVTYRTALKDLRLRGAHFDEAPGEAHDEHDHAVRGIADTPRMAPPAVEFARLEGVGRWRVRPGGWQFDAPRLRVEVAGDARAQVLDGVTVAGGQRYGLLADRVDAAPLFALVALSDRLDPGLRRWIADARPGGVAEQVVLTGERGGRVRFAARLSDLHVMSVGTAPGLGGLAGTLEGDGDGLVFTFDERARPRVDWPKGFGVPHDIRLRGRLIAWRDGPGWHIDTPALRIDGVGYGADLRGGLWFQGDGTRPWLDLAADVDDAKAPTAKKFWPKHAMSPALVEWLDRALIAGDVIGGRGVVAGDLDDWPFAQREGAPPTGVFDARATLRGMQVKFHPDWPATRTMDADIAFVRDGFEVTGSAGLADVPIKAFTAGVAHYARAELTIDADADADAAALLALMRQSPLAKQHGATLRTLAAGGPATVDFGLRLPMWQHGAPAQVQGTVALRGARLAETEWNVAFANVRGTGRFDQDGFDAEGLRALYDRQEGALSLRAGPTHVRDARNGFEAELDASMTSDDLIARTGERMAWLKPHMRGRSRWTAAITIPAGAATPTRLTALQLRSDLVGTALDLPAPMDKPAGTALPTRVDIALPLGKGEISVALGQRVALRVRDGEGQTGIRAAFGTDRIAEAPPASGLVLTGSTPVLDALPWITLLRGDGKGGGLPLRRIDVRTDRLLLLGSAFEDTSLRVLPATAGNLAVQLDGPALAGSLLVPDGEGGAIAGRLQRLYWRSAKAPVRNGLPAPPLAATGAEAAAADDDINPANVPAIQLRIDDLRVAGAALGDTVLGTRPTAVGMEILRLQTRAPKRRLDLTGSWTGRGAAARTRLDATIGSEDFGQLLTELGLGGRIEDGKGTVRFAAGWSGSPMGFSLASLDGELAVDVRDGQLVEVEPGAGRVLGLFSLAQLPRRLLLDFGDFFDKGFAFNTLAGKVRFADGSARSDEIGINGPSATITIRGAANLRAQTFDQTIEVVPKTGNLLTAVGAIAGGPVGAAVGAVANAVLQKPIGQMSAKHYRVTGPWREPKVEVIEAPATPRRGGR